MEKICDGDTASEGIGTGTVRFLFFDSNENNNLSEFKENEILVCDMTDIEFVPAMRKASAILTRTGGVLCHAAIISRELGKPCIVGIRDGFEKLIAGQAITVNATEGSVYRKEL